MSRFITLTLLLLSATTLGAQEIDEHVRILAAAIENVRQELTPDGAIALDPRVHPGHEAVAHQEQRTIDRAPGLTNRIAALVDAAVASDREVRVCRGCSNGVSAHFQISDPIAVDGAWHVYIAVKWAIARRYSERDQELATMDLRVTVSLIEGKWVAIRKETLRIT